MWLNSHLQAKSSHITRRLRRIHNAWRFQFKLNLVFKVQWFRFGGLRCSPLNAALVSLSENHQKFTHKVLKIQPLSFKCAIGLLGFS